MSLFEKLQTVIVISAVGLGISLGQVSYIEQVAEYFIVPFLLFMLYGLFLSVPSKDLKKALLNRKFASSSLIINFLWTPLLAWGLGAVFLSEHPALWIGFIMLMVTPCTDWYLAFTGIAKGSVALSTAILPMNLILQVLLLPIYLLLFTGVMKMVGMSVLLKSIILVLLLPFLLANLTTYIFNKRKQKETYKKIIVPFFENTQIIFLSLAIVAMFASQGRNLFENMNVVMLLFIPVILFFIINFLLGRIVSHFLKMSYEDSVSLNLTTLARNSPIALAIAVTAFPDKPLIALALVIGPLIELPVLAVVSQLLLTIRRNGKVSKNILGD
ncbi:MAG TPA: arsenic resistance protein [Virgibacillus sp.]|nr:arsenic resistance protein [Virgibacillus sp.]HLR65509.1 arsenic resistance protein [Virgibacillus sp.]